jgi:hypothetical protein
MIKDERLATLFEYLIEDAGMAIGYWAESAVHDSNKQTYTITVDVWTDVGFETKVLTYKNLYEATQKIADGEVSINPRTKAVCQQIISDPTDVDYDDVDYDAEDADCIVQVAMFDDVLFG